jgi:hypothetical protein
MNDNDILCEIKLAKKQENISHLCFRQFIFGENRPNSVVEHSSEGGVVIFSEPIQIASWQAHSHIQQFVFECDAGQGSVKSVQERT